MSSMKERPARSWGYRPAIDGLRSIAVLGVLLFHFDRRLLPGGFVGVDVFFVISGYLLTSILLVEVDRGGLSISRFYQRRIARIFPAFFVVIGVAFAAAALIYSAQDFASLGANSVAASLSVINMKLIFQGSYFKISPDAQPILHYWSLAVEEQYYFVFPAYLWAVTRFSSRPLAITGLVAVASLVACVVVTARYPVYAFYLLPTRAWELLAGASLAMFEWRRASPPREATERWLSFAGGALLVASFALIEENESFPGWVAVFPVLGSTLVLATASNPDLWLTRQLSRPLPVGVGKLSYSLYLWHWPTFSLVDYRFFEAGALFRGALKIGITLVASLATWRFVETPMRRYLNSPANRKIAFAGMAVCVTALCALGAYVRDSHYFDAAPSKLASGGTLVAGGSRGTVVLAGDSQASMYGMELASLAREKGFTLNILSLSGGNELPGAPQTVWPRVRAFIEIRKPDVVILANAWSYKIGSDPAPLREALEDIAAHAGHVILMGQQQTLPREASREGVRAGAKAPFREEPDARVVRETAMKIVESFASDRVAVLDVERLFVAPDGGIQIFGEGRRLNFQDAGHLSDTGTAKVRAMLEAAILGRLGRGTASDEAR